MALGHARVPLGGLLDVEAWGSPPFLLTYFFRAIIFIREDPVLAAVVVREPAPV